MYLTTGHIEQQQLVATCNMHRLPNALRPSNDFDSALITVRIATVVFVHVIRYNDAYIRGIPSLPFYGQYSSHQQINSVTDNTVSSISPIVSAAYFQ